MPVKRRATKHKAHPVTPAAIAAFRAGEWLTLHRELKLQPWMPSPLDAVRQCHWRPGSAGEEYWPLAVAVRAELEASDAG
jgi:hypothetical protein